MFVEAIVIEYISDITKLDQTTISNIINNSRVIDPNFLSNCPNGTIIAKTISANTNNQTKVYFPFFSHISMPVKAGERVWVFSPGGAQVSYWITRKVQNRAAEDLNFSNDDRARIYASLTDDATKRQKNSAYFYDGQQSGVSLKQVRSGSYARSEFIGEPVSNLVSKSVDLTIQGSNNTVINLSHNNLTGSGTIDIVAGIAGITSQTVENSYKYLEALKPPLSTDSDASTIGLLSAEDESRITISRLFNSDSYYSLTGDNSGDQPSIAIKTNSVRIIAKNDLKIVVGDGADPSSIIMKSNGDIVITPSSAGVIRLGGEDANGAIVTSTLGTTVTAGIVTGASIVDTAGGAIGVASQSATGVFATKVLVK